MQSVPHEFCPGLRLVVTLIFFIASPAFASMPLPVGQRVFSYASTSSPTVDGDPALAEPIGVGPVAKHGDTLELQCALDTEGPVNVYVAILAPPITSDLLMLTPSNTLEPFSAVGLMAWKSGVSGSVNESLFGSVPASALPLATYTIFLAISPSSALETYYLWSTQFTAGATFVDSSGGQVGTAQGAMVRFPPGALAGPTAISVGTFGEPGTMPSPAFYPGDAVFGGGRFRPDGLTFTAPVTITLPLSGKLPPGTQIPVYTYDTAGQGWLRTEFVAHVNPDGGSADAEVTHFTDFILMFRDMENTDIFFGQFIDAFFDICNVIPIPQLFDAYVNYFSLVYPLGEKRIYDFSFEFPRRDYGCYEVVGYSFVLSAQRELPDDSSQTGWVPYEGGTWEREVGRKGSVALTYQAAESRDIADSRCGEQSMSFDWTVDIHLNCAQPALALQASQSPIAVGEEVPVHARMDCGRRPMVGQRLKFAIEGDGTLDTTEVKTDNAGFATVNVTGTSDAQCSDGDVTVTADYRSCPGQEQESLLEQFIEEPVIFFLGGSWSATEVADETDCGEGVNTYRSSATVSHVGDAVGFSGSGGTGSATKVDCILSGWSRESEDDGVTYTLGNGTITPDANMITGQGDWVWEGTNPDTGEKESCRGTSRITMRRNR